MIHFCTLMLLFFQVLALPAAATHTGFCYGEEWANGTTKTKEDFIRQFTAARNLKGAPVPFTSARLFTSIQGGTKDSPTAAFEAAIETNTTLMIGIWLAYFDSEWKALHSAFEKHGQKLADLVVGISVGNEDYYRTTDLCIDTHAQACKDGYSFEKVVGMIRSTRQRLSEAPWAHLFEEPPAIGHTDIIKLAPLFWNELDFVGINVHPFWSIDPIPFPNVMMMKHISMTFKVLQARSRTTPIWIMETGWPFEGTQQQATLANMEIYWKTTGCSVFGKFNVWWFQLEKDSVDGPDWGIMDPSLQEPRFDLSCPGLLDAQIPQSNLQEPLGRTLSR